MAENGPAETSAARPDHATAIAEVLADAFHDDPVMSWLVPDARRRPAALLAFFGFETEHVALHHDVSLVAGRGVAPEGAALVLPPGHWRAPFGRQVRHSAAFLGMFRGRLPHALGLQMRMERMHPRDPHYYLPAIGVAREAQGSGIGSELLAELGRRCDRERVPAYLEASSPDNARLYRRHGFETLELLSFAGSPPLELMLRPIS